MVAEHSPTPWAVGFLSPDDEPSTITVDDGTKYHRRTTIAKCKVFGFAPEHAVNRANAEHIVKCVNGWDALNAENARLREALKTLMFRVAYKLDEMTRYEALRPVVANLRVDIADAKAALSTTVSEVQS